MQGTLPNKPTPITYILAGACFFLFAHVGYNGVLYIANKLYGVDVFLNLMGVYIPCASVADKSDPEVISNLRFYRYSYYSLLLISVIGGFFLTRNIVPRGKIKSTVNWIGIFFLLVPLYQGVQYFAEAIFRYLMLGAKGFGAYRTSFTIIFIAIFFAGLFLGIVTFMKFFYKKERIYLAFISLPVYVLTYFSYFYIWGYMLYF